MDQRTTREPVKAEPQTEVGQQEQQHIFSDADVHKLLFEASRHWDARTPGKPEA